MTAAVDSAVIDARPPALVVRLTNLIMRPLLRTPAGRLIKPLALLEFTGRHSGTRRRVIVGWHRDGTTAIVVTPAPWRANFDHGCPSTVYWCGQRSTLIGTLDTDPVSVATAVDELLHAGTRARSLALDIPAGHTLDHFDIARTNRQIIRFERAVTTNSEERTTRAQDDNGRTAWTHTLGSAERTLPSIAATKSEASWRVISCQAWTVKRTRTTGP